ncbi:MAG: AI-2E family transporter, partial [Gammaproteobacteria bacterium]|nr:AI-2E family transporter [Gammaproteobacteria bacterium]
MNNKTLNYTLLALVGLFALLYALGPVLTPFAIALVLAYLCNPIVIRLSRYITRGGAIALVYVFLTLLITILAVVVLPLLAHQIEELITALPETLLALKNHWQPRILERMGID